MERFTLLTIAILLFASITKAQISKGSIFIGGQVSGYTSKTDGGTYNQEYNGVSFSPAIGVAVKQNLIAGIELNYAHSKTENGFSPTQKANNYGGGFFLRKYVPIFSRFYFFTQGTAGYNHNETKSNSGTYSSSSKSNGGSLSFYPGVSLALTKALYVETGFNNLVVIGYSHGTAKQTGFQDQSTNNFNFSTSVSGTNLSFALRFIIPKK